jgi:outer membrane protein assembly factor BamB
MTGNGTGIAPLSSPALSDGVLYVASQAQTTFTALDAATGATRWIYTGISTFSDPAVWSGHIYTASLDGNLYAFPTSCTGTCTPTWKVPVGTLGTNSPPTLFKGSVYIGGYDGRVYAFDAKTGSELWNAQVNPRNVADPLNFAPAVSEDRVFVSGDGAFTHSRELQHALRTSLGYPTKFSPAAAPTVAGETVLVADYAGTIYAMDAGTGAIQWKGKIEPIPHSIAVAGGVAYVTSGSWRTRRLRRRRLRRPSAARSGRRRRQGYLFSPRRSPTGSSMSARSIHLHARRRGGVSHYLHRRMPVARDSCPGRSERDADCRRGRSDLRHDGEWQYRFARSASALARPVTVNGKTWS